MSDDRLLLTVCEARIRAKVVEILQYDDSVVVDMIFRHVVRCATHGDGEDADISGLRDLLAIVVGKDHAATLSDALLAEPAQPEQVRREPFSSWPFDDSVGPLPSDAASRLIALEENGPLFGTTARGVEVRRCADPSMGHGVFATRTLHCGELVGVYLGERLTFNNWWLRHGAERDGVGCLIGVARQGIGS